MPGLAQPISFRPGQREKQLGQLHPTDTNPAQLYTPGAGIRGVVTSILVCNTDVGGQTFQIFHDDDGTTRTIATALYHDETIGANTTREIFAGTPDGWGVANGGEIAVQASVANAMTFTAYGYEVNED